MNARLAAGYVGEDTAEAFLKRVGPEYPEPRVNNGRRKLWLRDDLDRSMGILAEKAEFENVDDQF